MFVRVRSLGTGHQFDIDEASLPGRRGVELLNDDRWPPSREPRPPLPKRPLGTAHPRTRKPSATQAAAQDPDTTTTPAGDPDE